MTTTTEKQSRIYEEPKQTAAKIRATLKKAFPDVSAKHFSVRTSTYAGGSSISITWEDYPTYDEVTEIANRFESKELNSMEDYADTKGYRWEDGKVYRGADYVFCTKNFSTERQAKIAEIAEVHYAGEELNRVLMHKIDVDLSVDLVYTAPKASTPLMDQTTRHSLLPGFKFDISHQPFYMRELVKYQIEKLLIPPYDSINTVNYLEEKINVESDISVNGSMSSNELIEVATRYAARIIDQNQRSYRAYNGVLSSIAMFSYVGFRYTGAELPHEYLVGIADSVKESPKNYDSMEDWLLHVTPYVVKQLGQHFEGSSFEQRDQKILLEALQPIKDQKGDAVYQSVLNSVNTTELIPLKHIDRMIQIKQFQVYITSKSTEETPEMVMDKLLKRIQNASYDFNAYEKETYAKVAFQVDAIQHAFRQQTQTNDLWTRAVAADGVIFWLVNNEMLVIHPRFIGNYHSGAVYFTTNDVNLRFGDVKASQVDQVLHPVFTQTLIQLVQERKKGVPSKSVTYTQEDVRRMQRLAVAIEGMRSQGSRVTGTFKEVNGLMMFVIVGRNNRTLLVNPYGIILVEGQSQSALVKRTASEPFSVFESTMKYFMKVYDDFALSKSIEKAIQVAFDFRHIVEKDGKKY